MMTYDFERELGIEQNLEAQGNPARREDNRVALRCNECGKKRKVSPDGNYNERCPKCGGVDWNVL